MLGDSRAEVNVSKRGPSIRMAELLLRDFRSVSRVDDETGDAVTERVKSAARNIERVKNRPELILDDLVAGWWPPVPSGEQKPLRIGFPFRPVFTENGSQRTRQGDRRRAFFALCGL